VTPLHGPVGFSVLGWDSEHEFVCCLSVSVLAVCARTSLAKDSKAGPELTELELKRAWNSPHRDDLRSSAILTSRKMKEVPSFGKRTFLLALGLCMPLIEL